MGEEALKIKDLELADIPGAKQNFDLALRTVKQAIQDMEEGIVEDGKVTLTLSVCFDPKDDGDGVDVTCTSSVKLPKYPAKSLFAHFRRGKFRVVEADQAELPGVTSIRTKKPEEG